MRPASRVFPVLLSVVLAAPATAQLQGDDSLAVIGLVRRYHAALQAGDTASVKAMLAPGATSIESDSAMSLRGEALKIRSRWDRAIIRTPVRMAARVFGPAAYVYTVSKIAARAAPDAINGDEVESIFLSRLGTTWFIELVHLTVGSPP